MMTMQNKETRLERKVEYTFEGCWEQYHSLEGMQY